MDDDTSSLSRDGYAERSSEDDFNSSRNLWADSGSSGARRPISRRTPRGPGIVTHNCLACYQKKTKCDRRADGCANCSKAGISCTYLSQKSPGPQKRGPYNKGVVRRNVELEQKVTALQATVERLSSQLEGENVEIVHDKTGTRQRREIPTPQEETIIEETAVVFGSSPTGDGGEEAGHRGAASRLGSIACSSSHKTLPSISWGDFVGKFDENPENVVDHENRKDISESSSTDVVHEDLMSISDKSSRASLHPSAHLIREYWNTFKTKVDPLLKILHIPTVEKYLLAGTGIPTEAIAGMDAVMFSVYYAAIINSPTPTGSNTETRDARLLKYSCAIRRILANPDVLASSGILPLQALVIYLYHVQPDGAQSEYLWMGTALRMAQAHGVHRDGKFLNKTPFETEMLRRLWWNIYRLERRFVEDYISHPFAFEPQFDTLLPSNINDSDLLPEDTELAAPKLGRTEMTFCLVDFKISALTFNIMKQHPSKGLAAQKRRADMVREVMKKLTEEHLQFCDPENDFDFMIIAYAKLSLSRIWLLAHHPSRYCLDRLLTDVLPMENNHENNCPVRNVLPLALEAFEYSQVLPEEPRMAPWAWFWKVSKNTQRYLEFYLLAEICYRPSDSLVERAWKVLDEAAAKRRLLTYSASDAAKSPAGPLEVMLSKLRTRVVELRRKERSGSNTLQSSPISVQRQSPNHTPPSFGKLYQKSGNRGKEPLCPGTLTPILSDSGLSTPVNKVTFNPVDLSTPADVQSLAANSNGMNDLRTSGASIPQLGSEPTAGFANMSNGGDNGVMSEFLSSNNLTQDLYDAYLGISPWFQFPDDMTGMGVEAQTGAGWDDIMKGLMR